MTRQQEKEYVVKDITGHSTYNGTTHFRVIWEDFSYTYEPIRHLLKCGTLVKNYCLQADVPVPKAKFGESIGAATEHQVNRQNFVQIKKVIETINTYGTARRWGVERVVPVSNRVLEKEKYIMILSHNNHGYVIAVNNSSKEITISDSTNNYSMDDDAKKTISGLFPNYNTKQVQ